MTDKANIFAKYFKECYINSLGMGIFEKTQADANFQADIEKCTKLYDEIYEKLGEDGRLIDRFDSAKNHLLGIQEEYVYQQGFKDCVYLLNWIGLI